MTIRLAARVSAAAIAIAFAASPAFAADMKHHTTHHAAKHPAHHAAGAGKLQPTAAGDAAVADLNAQSLAAAQAGQSFTPSATPSAPAAQAQPRAPMAHHKKM